MDGKKPSFLARTGEKLKNLLRQGVTPERLALSLALGLTIGVSPALGLTSLVCIAVGMAFRLNHVAMQIPNWIVYPFQFILLIPFVRLGERVFGGEAFPLSASEITALVKAHPIGALSQCGIGLLHAFEGWVVVGIPATVAAYVAMLPLMRRMAARLAVSSPTAPAPRAEPLASAESR